MLEISNVNVHVLELIALPMALILLSTSIRARMTVANKAAIGAYAVASSAVLGSILISGLVAMDPGAVLLKGVLKWVEIIGLSWVVLTYCSSMRRFQQIWIILILTTLLTIVGTFYLDFVRPYFSGEFTSWPRSSVILTAFRRISGADALLVVVLTAPFRARRWGRLMGLVCLALTLLSLSRSQYQSSLRFGKAPA
ncbi:MAG: hypothetical protein QN194_13710 [Armatimonadota bacterium]|nr:hypothetical protein [Armatimonadota bacterium]MDR7573964.1 hypothetical protein [Armatimonadota bacterium]